MWNRTPPVISHPVVLRIRQGGREWLSSVWNEDTRTGGEGGLLLTRPNETFPVYWDDVCSFEEPYEWAPLDAA